MTEPTSEIDTVGFARTALRDLLESDRTLTIAALARRIGISDQTLNHFVREGSEVVPRPHVWSEIDSWVRSLAATKTRGRVRERPSAESGERGQLYSIGVATGMAQGIQRMLQSVLEEQERLVAHLQNVSIGADTDTANAALDVSVEALQRRKQAAVAAVVANATAKAGSELKAPVKPFLTNAQIDADLAAHDELIRKVEAGKKAKKSKKAG